MSKIRILIMIFILSVLNLFYGQDVSKDLGQVNSFLKKQNLYSASIAGLGVVDKILLFLENSILNSIVDLENYRLISTNTFSRIIMEKGNYDVELYSQKTFSNEICTLVVTIDATEEAFEKNYSLYVSYDYLTERKDFKKLELTNKNQKIPLIIENETAIMIYPTTESEPFKGFIVREDFIFNRVISEKEKEDIMMRDLKRIADGLYKNKLTTFLK